MVKIRSSALVPSVEEEDARRVHRERERLIKERIQHVNRIKGLLASQGIYNYEPLKRYRIDRFEALKTAMGTAIPMETKLMRARTRLTLRMCRISMGVQTAPTEPVPRRG